MRTNTVWMAALLVVAAASWAGCGTSSTPTDTAQPDVPADVADVAGDPGTPDVADTGDRDTTPADTTVADTPVDTPVDVATDEGPEIPWETLPKLPSGKTFTTKYVAGVGRGDLSPVKPTFLGGFGFCSGAEDACRKTDGVHDPLLASAVAIADPATGEMVIFVGVDTIGLIRKDIDDLHEKVQMKLYEDFGIYLPGIRTVIGASHAHSSCDTVGLWGPMFGYGRDEEYTAIVKNAIVKAARDAVADLQDVTLTWGKGDYKNSSEDIYNHDQEMYVMKGTKPDASTLFTFVRWPGHPTTYGSDMMAASADWVGTMRKKLEDTLGGMNVFLQGPIGSVYPERPSTCGLDQEAFPEGDHTKTDMDPGNYMKVTCTGYAIGAAALTALETAVPVAETGIAFQHSTFQFHPDNEVLMYLAEIGPLPYDWADVNDPDSRMLSEFSIARIGDLTYVTTPGESFPTFSEMAKGNATEASLPHPITLGLAQDWMGYLLSPEQWADINLSYNVSLSPGKGCFDAYDASLRALLSLPARPAKTTP
jgi:hypothetical protein